MLALAAAALVLSAAAHPAYGDGTCVDVTIDGRTVPDTLCPVADPLAVRTITAKGRTVYFGVARATVTLTFATRTVKARPGADGAYAVAVKGTPRLGAIAAGAKARDVDVFALPPIGRRVTITRLRDEANRRVRIVAAAPKVLRKGGRRRATLCSGIQLSPAFTPGRTLCRGRASTFQVRFSADCEKDRQLVYGLAPRRIARAVAVLSGGGTAPVTVTKVPQAVGRPGVVLSARLTGALATKVRGYGADGKLLASAPLGAGCSAG